MQDSEDKIQAEYNMWLIGYYPKLRNFCFHVPNGGKRDSEVNAKGERFSREGNKLKAMGVRRGIPDYWHAVPLNGYIGFIIEFKEPGANMNTPHVKVQTEVQNDLRSVGYKVIVCDNTDEAKKQFLDYFKGSHWLDK